ncbi:Endonuclease/exonuclease/phosphatase [Trametes meyenii]|nr:Endonuclease/exonuclease/phosphatase [Trametes meyenii]
MATHWLGRTFFAFCRLTLTRKRVLLSSRKVHVWTQVAPGSNLSLTSWNIDAFSPRPISRAKLILSRILEDPNSPDIIFLQEVTTDVRASLLGDARVRTAFLVADTKDWQTTSETVPFMTMTLLSRTRFSSSREGSKLRIGRISRMELPSKYGRDALCVDIISPVAPDSVYRLLNVHLDSLGDTFHYRAAQMGLLAEALHRPECTGGLIAGDFNAISPEDDDLIVKHGLVDGWVALHGGVASDGATWGVGVKRRGRLGPRRLDKVATTVNCRAEAIEVIRPGVIEVPKPGGWSIEIPWSDHFGLRCIFSI